MFLIINITSCCDLKTKTIIQHLDHDFEKSEVNVYGCVVTKSVIITMTHHTIYIWVKISYQCKTKFHHHELAHRLIYEELIDFEEFLEIKASEHNNILMICVEAIMDCDTNPLFLVKVDLNNRSEECVSDKNFKEINFSLVPEMVKTLDCII